MPKSVGGLGFRHAFDLNKALISKLGWSIRMKSDKPWVKLLKAKYLRGKNLLTTTAKPNASPIWKGIINFIPHRSIFGMTHGSPPFKASSLLPLQFLLLSI